VTKRIALGVLVLAVVAAPVVSAEQGDDSNDERIRRLERIIESQEARIAELEKSAGERQDEQGGREHDIRLVNSILEQAEKDSTDFRAFWQDGLRMETSDKRFKLAIGGRFQADWVWMDGGSFEGPSGIELADGVELRRARIYTAGTIYKFVQFRAEYELAGGDADLSDIYIRLIEIPFVGNFTVGHFQEPFGLEQLTSPTYTTFMEPSVTDMFAPSRNMGFMMNNAVCDDRMTWAIGLFRDTDSYGEGSVDGGYNMTARVTGAPVYADAGRKVVHLGAAYSLRDPEETVRWRRSPDVHLAPDFVDTGDFSADNVNLLSAEAAMVWGPFSLQGEYVGAIHDRTSPGANREIGSNDNPCFNSFYVLASYFLTGEHRPYIKKTGTFGRIRPKKNFREDGGWGAWEVAVRYGYVDLNSSDADIEGGILQTGTVGLNWYLNPNTRVMFNYVRACQADYDGVDIFGMRFQIDF